LLDVFAFAPDTHPLPRPTLADGGSPKRRQNPSRAATDPSYGFDEAGWQRFAVGLQRAVDHCRSRGFEPTLHPEAGTHVEARWEIDRALQVTDIGLCLETGHEVVGGGDPLSTLQDYGSRINHVHLKDATRSIIEGIVRDAEPVETIWSRRAFPPLGQGDVAIHEILELLLAQGYSGWLVVEQDIMPGPDDPESAHSDQVANRARLSQQGI
ncbi:MAG: TIM barrel protein, partial [Acidimicrobiales bacterium]